MRTTLQIQDVTNQSSQDDRGAYLPSQFRIKVECSRLRKYGNGVSLFPWDDYEHQRRMKCCGVEVEHGQPFTDEAMTIPMVSDDSFRNEYGELVA
jgi:hypothetical protein